MSLRRVSWPLASCQPRDKVFVLSSPANKSVSFQNGISLTSGTQQQHLTQDSNTLYFNVFSKLSKQSSTGNFFLTSSFYQIVSIWLPYEALYWWPCLPYCNPLFAVSVSICCCFRHLENIWQSLTQIFAFQVNLLRILFLFLYSRLQLPFWRLSISLCRVSQL